jgi:hypothetical protein
MTKDYCVWSVSGNREEAIADVSSGGNSYKNSRTVIGTERIVMNKERLDWVVSGLNQHALTKAEDQFLKTALENFDKNQALTERQEKRLEKLYKEKSQLIPNKKSDLFSL